MSTRIRKHESGTAKRKKKQRLEVKAQSLTDYLDRYLVKYRQQNFENHECSFLVEHEVRSLLCNPFYLFSITVNICLNKVQIKQTCNYIIK